MRIFLPILIAALLTVTAGAKDIEVPGDYPHIQAAILAASAGDRVIVAPGTYKENIDFRGKAVEVIGLKGYLFTFIDGQKKGSVVTFKNQEGPGSVLRGFTLIHGSGTGPNYYEEGGGIYCYTASPVIEDNRILENRVGLMGGGMHIEDGDPLVRRNLILDNDADEGPGGGISVEGGAPVFEANYLKGNSGYTAGGGFRIKDSGALLSSNIIVKNSAWGSFFAGDNPPPPVDVLGGGIYISSTTLVRVLNCTVYANGVTAQNGDVYGSGIYASGSAEVVNAIVYKNYGEGAQQIQGTPQVSFSDVQFGHSGNGNIDAVPGFMDPNHNDYHLRHDSPCRDAGDGSVVNPGDLDFEGDPRLHESGVDMGADEFHRHLYVQGHLVPGGHADLRIVGQPLSGPVVLGVGKSLLNTPIKTGYGLWYLELPMALMIVLPPVPADGIFALDVVIPTNFPAPASLPLQALVKDAFTNHTVLVIQ